MYTLTMMNCANIISHYDESCQHHKDMHYDKNGFAWIIMWVFLAIIVAILSVYDWKRGKYIERALHTIHVVRAVNIRLTEQLDDALKRAQPIKQFAWDLAAIPFEPDITHKCPICWSTDESIMITLPCRHPVCIGCAPSTNSKNECPTCRTRIDHALLKRPWPVPKPQDRLQA